MIRPSPLWFALGIATISGVLACDQKNGGSGVMSRQGSNGPQESTQPSSQPTAEAPASSTGLPTGQMSASNTTAVKAGQTTVDVSNLDDAGLAGVLESLHQRIVEVAQLGESQAKSKDVKQLAQGLDARHGDDITIDQKLFQRVSIVPKQTPASQQIDSDRVASIKMLRGTRPADFDKRFLDVEGHATSESIQLFDRIATLAKSPDLKTEVIRTRPQLVEDSKNIARVRQTLFQGVTNPQGPGSGDGK